MSTGSIIIQHLGYDGIDMAQILEALPEDVRQGERQGVVIDQRDAVVAARTSRDWAEARRLLVADFDAKVRPLMETHPGHRIQYFGSASIPLMMLLGYKTDTWRSVVAYNRHHTRKVWKWDAPAGPPIAVKIDLDHLPKKPSLAQGDIVVRVAVSYRVEPALTEKVVPAPLAEIDISVATPALDVIASPAGVDAVAQCFREALDAVQTIYPHARMVHVFAAVPPGVAYRLGTVVSSTMHARIQTYELDRAGPPGGYYPALVLQDAAAPKMVPTDEELQVLSRERVIWQEELQGLQRIAQALRAAPRAWTDEIDGACARHAGSRWAALPSIRELRGIDRGPAKAQVDQSTTTVEGGFTFDGAAATWRLDDGFLLSILRRIPDEQTRRRAARLFLLHEGVHDDQCLTQGTSASIGRFGKVLEELDYQADVWALFYEYRAGASASPEAVAAPSQFFRDLVHVAMEIMMAFDDAGGPTEEMQARRISRYLIWSWQYLELERASTLEDCFAILCEKPVLELHGLQTRWDDGRLLCSLLPAKAPMLEVAVLRRSRLERYGLGSADRLDRVLDSLRAHKPEELRRHLHAIADRILSPRKA